MSGRYFPFAQEFNSDPEGWELTETFGDRALRTWVEILAILDRERNVWKLTNGWQTVIGRKVRQAPATVQRVVDWMLAKGWLEVGQLSADGQPEVLRAPKYRKYRKLRAEAAPPPNLTEPNLTEPTKRRELRSSPRLVSVQQTLPKESALSAQWPTPQMLIERYNEKTPDECPAVTVVSPARIDKAKKYLAMFPKEEFWDEVWRQIHASRFLRGLNKNGNGHDKFVADFDWLLSKGKDQTENVCKVHDGRYRDGR